MLSESLGIWVAQYVPSTIGLQGCCAGAALSMINVERTVIPKTPNSS